MWCVLLASITKSNHNHTHEPTVTIAPTVMLPSWLHSMLSWSPSQPLPPSHLGPRRRHRCYGVGDGAAAVMIQTSCGLQIIVHTIVTERTHFASMASPHRQISIVILRLRQLDWGRGCYGWCCWLRRLRMNLKTASPLAAAAAERPGRCERSTLFSLMMAYRCGFERAL